VWGSGLGVEGWGFGVGGGRCWGVGEPDRATPSVGAAPSTLLDVWSFRMYHQLERNAGPEGEKHARSVTRSDDLTQSLNHHRKQIKGGPHLVRRYKRGGAWRC
jgi:hypothetical protein